MGRAHHAIHVIVVATALAACGGSGGSSSAVPSGATTPTPAPTVAPSSPFDAVIEQNYAGGWGVELAVYRNAALVYAHGYRYLWHDGAIGGFQTVNATFPDDGIDIVILTNDGTGLDPYYVVPDLFRLALSSTAAQRIRAHGYRSGRANGLGPGQHEERHER
jgi:CubicO group peptidase (beta-lactamase class C family)